MQHSEMYWAGSGLRYKKVYKNYQKMYKNYMEEYLSVLWFPNIKSAVFPNIHCGTRFKTCALLTQKIRNLFRIIQKLV